MQVISGSESCSRGDSGGDRDGEHENTLRTFQRATCNERSMTCRVQLKHSHDSWPQWAWDQVC